MRMKKWNLDGVFELALTVDTERSRKAPSSEAGMNDPQTEEEWQAFIEAEQRAKARFASLRRYNSSRRVRQEAWRDVEWFQAWRRARAFWAHPIQPAARWYDFNNTAPEGWTYPSLRTLEPDEVRDLFPGAVEALATQCNDIPFARMVFDQWSSGGRLRLSVPRPYTRNGNVTWMPEARVWRRYTRAVKVKPYRTLDTGCP